MNISEKAAYLKGLISGMEYDVNSREGKLFAGIIDLLEEALASRGKETAKEPEA